MPQRPAIAVVGVVGFAIALALGGDAASATGAFEQFLFLLGSVFVPLYGVLIAGYFVRGGSGFASGELFDPRGRYRFAVGFNLRAIVPWIVGFLVYHWCGAFAPAWWMSGFEAAVRSVGLPYPLFEGTFGASIPAFAAAFVVALPLAAPRR